jgi:hypothetical protein
MVNLKKLAEGVMLTGTIMVLLYGPHALQRSTIQDSFSPMQQSPIVEKNSVIIDYSKRIATSGLGIIGLGAGIFYFTRKREDY